MPEAADDARVIANYAVLKTAANFIFGATKSALQITVAYHDNCLVFIKGNSEAKVPASGSWPGIVYFYDDGLRRRLDHVSVSDNSIVIRVNTGRLVIGECVVPCEWKPERAAIDEAVRAAGSKRKPTRVDVWDLKFVGNKKALPSVEVDTGDDDAVFAACQTAISAVLGTLPKSRRITIYVYETPSVNFGRQTNSIYFVVGGPDRVAQTLYAALKTVAGADVRYGEYIRAESCIPYFHYEDGMVWRPEDGDEWSSS